jgi:Tfp pilus assembly protein PilN
MPTLTTEGPSPMIAGLAIIVLVGAGLYLYYLHLQSQHEKLQASLSQATKSITAMRQVKQAYMERQKEYDAFKRRFDIIDQLRAAQSSPVPLLSSVSDTVDKTDGVWLLTMRDDGASVSLEGVALGPNAVAKLMTNLRGSGYFKDVKLHEAVEEDTQKLQTFSFSLVCEKTKA